MLSRIYDLLLPLCGRVLRGGAALEMARLGWHRVTRSAGSWGERGLRSWGFARTSLHPRLTCCAPPGHLHQFPSETHYRYQEQQTQERRSLMNSHRQSRWINYELDPLLGQPN